MNVYDCVNTHKQEDSCSDEDLTDNVESFIGLVLRNCNADRESRAASHAKTKAQDRVEKLPAIQMEQTVERGQE